jgi:hypothetical protein
VVVIVSIPRLSSISRSKTAAPSLFVTLMLPAISRMGLSLGVARGAPTAARLFTVIATAATILDPNLIVLTQKS